METEPRIILRRLQSLSAEATSDLAAAIGRRLEATSVLALSGDLGAGKTCFVRGLALGLEVAERVSSPTYTLMHSYEGRLPLYHFDAWMEGRERAFLSDGGADWLDCEGVSVVEWAERVEQWLPRPYLAIELRHLGLEQRLLLLSVVGEGAAGGPLTELVLDMPLPEGIREAPADTQGDPP